MLNKNNLETRLKVIYFKFSKASQLLAINILFNEKKDIVFRAKINYEKKHDILFYLSGPIII